MKPTLYFIANEDGTFHISAKKYETNSDDWENNNIQLKATWFRTAEATFNVLSNICNQAGIVLIAD